MRWARGGTRGAPAPDGTFDCRMCGSPVMLDLHGRCPLGHRNDVPVARAPEPEPVPEPVAEPSPRPVAEAEPMPAPVSGAAPETAADETEPMSLEAMLASVQETAHIAAAVPAPEPAPEPETEPQPEPAAMPAVRDWWDSPDAWLAMSGDQPEDEQPAPRPEPVSALDLPDLPEPDPLPAPAAQEREILFDDEDPDDEDAAGRAARWRSALTYGGGVTAIALIGLAAVLLPDL